MKKLDKFLVHGTAAGEKNSVKLDEISILSDPETIRKIGEFLISAAYDMECNDLEHMHLQDKFDNFSDAIHVDIIVLNSRVVHET